MISKDGSDFELQTVRYSRQRRHGGKGRGGYVEKSSWLQELWPEKLSLSGANSHITFACGEFVCNVVPNGLDAVLTSPLLTCMFYEQHTHEKIRGL